MCTRSQVTRCCWWWHSSTEDWGHDWGPCAGAQHHSRPHTGSALAAAGPGGSTFHLRTDRSGSVTAPPGQGCRTRPSQSWAASCHPRVHSQPSGHVAKLQDARAGQPCHELGFTPASPGRGCTAPAQVSLDLGNPQVPAWPWALRLLQRGQKAGVWRSPGSAASISPCPAFGTLVCAAGGRAGLPCAPVCDTTHAAAP